MGAVATGIAAGLATGGMSALGALISGLFGNHQVEETNESNEAQNTATNESNERIVDATNQANKEISDATNKSNAEIAAATNDTNKAISDSVNETNKAIAEQNLGFQRENLEYQKALQQQIFEREDTAYQRTAQDMAAAGINPLMMNGTDASGDVVSTTPLQNDYQATGYQAQGYEAKGATMIASKAERFQKQMMSFEWLANAFNSIGDGVNQALEHGFQIDSLNNQLKNDEVERFVKMRDVGYFGNMPEGYVFKVPTQDGKPVNPADWNGKLDNPNDFYNPENQYFLDRIGNLRQLQHDARYGMFSNSTDFERNVTALQTMLDNRRLESIAHSIKGQALDLFFDFQKMYNRDR